MGIRLNSEFALVVGIALWVVIRSLMLLKNRKYKRFLVHREIFINILAVYFVSLIGITLFPISINWDGVTPKFYPMVNLIPLVDIINYFPQTHFSLAFKIKFLSKNLVGNLFLLVPIGILMPILWTRMRNFWKTVIIGASISLIIELLQYVLAYLGFGWGRATDIDDLILNTLGVMIGYVIFDKSLVRFNYLKSLNE